MSEILNRLRFQEGSMSTQLWLAAAIIWLAVLLCAITSIMAQPFSKRQRYAWLAIVTLVPIFGLLAYLPFSIRRDELPTAFLMRNSARDKNRGKRGTRNRLPAGR